MEIQWPLAIFTFLAGTGGWLIAFTAANEFLRKLDSDKTRFAALIVGIVLVVLGGCASVLHLSHPERIMGALGHPTSGIFTEALMVGLTSLATIIYVVMTRRGVSANALKAVAAVSGVLGVVLSFVCGASYMMEAQPIWDNILLPLSYLGTAAVTGAALYEVFAETAPEGAGRAAAAKFMAACALVAGIVAALLVAAYGLTSGAASIADGTALFAVAIVGSVLAAVLGFAGGWKRPSVGMAVAAVVCGAAGCLAFRCFMWVVGTGTFSFFDTANFFATI